MLSKDTKNNHIIVKNTHFVGCSDPQSFKSLPSPFWLSPMEQLSHHSVAIDAVWIDESFPDLSEPVRISRLQAALTRLLDYYPTLTGRLPVQPQTGLRSIDRFGSGIKLLEAACTDHLLRFIILKRAAWASSIYPKMEKPCLGLGKELLRVLNATHY